MYQLITRTGMDKMTCQITCNVCLFLPMSLQYVRKSTRRKESDMSLLSWEGGENTQLLKDVAN